MDAADAAKVLGRAAATDNRTVTEAAALAWAESLDPDVTLGDALDAVAAHYGESRDWVMPADVNRRVKAIHRERIRADGTPPIPGGLEYHQEQAWRRAYHEQIRQGESRPDAETVANQSIGYTPPTEIDRPVRAAIERQERRWSA